jgi:RNA polymerase sigma factor (sigma-70 family)
LLALLRRLALEPSDAEDIAAEALARAFTRWDRLAPAEWRVAWVIRVATNLSHDRARRLGRSQRLQPRLVEGHGGEFDLTVVDRMVLASALAGLPRRQREAVALHHVADLSIEDTAQAMGVAPGTARTHLERAMARLRQVLAPVRGGGPEEVRQLDD